MYTELIQRCKQMYLTESDKEEESFYQLPSFLDSIACVLIHLDKVTPNVIRTRAATKSRFDLVDPVFIID